MAAQIRPVKYDLVTGDDVATVNKRVNALLDQGWVPHGNTSVISTIIGIAYSQPMIKLEIVNVNVANEAVKGQNISMPGLQ